MAPLSEGARWAPGSAVPVAAAPERGTGQAARTLPGRPCRDAAAKLCPRSDVSASAAWRHGLVTSRNVPVPAGSPLTERSGRAGVSGEGLGGASGAGGGSDGGFVDSGGRGGGSGPEQDADPGPPRGAGTSQDQSPMAPGEYRCRPPQPDPGAPGLPARAGGGTAAPGSAGRCPRRSPHPLPGTARSSRAPSSRAPGRGSSSGAARRGDL